MPPLIKVYEGLGAVADGRVRLEDEHRAAVTSSDASKTYLVEIDGCEVSSNDNASYWQGYLGYPAIAVMMVRGDLHFDQAMAQALVAIPWKELNRRFHNDYDRTLSEVNRLLAARGHDPATVERHCAALLEEVRAQAPIRSGPRRRPPRSQGPQA